MCHPWSLGVKSDLCKSHELQSGRGIYLKDNQDVLPEGVLEDKRIEPPEIFIFTCISTVIKHRMHIYRMHTFITIYRMLQIVMPSQN